MRCADEDAALLHVSGLPNGPKPGTGPWRLPVALATTAGMTLSPGNLGSGRAGPRLPVIAEEPPIALWRMPNKPLTEVQRFSVNTRWSAA